MSSWQIEPAAIIQMDQSEYDGIPIMPHTSQMTTPVNHTGVATTGVAKHMIFRARRVLAHRLGLRFLSVIHRSERRFINIRVDDFKRSSARADTRY